MIVHETLTIILIFLSLLFSVFLLSVPSINKLGNRILAIFLIIRALDAGSIFFQRLNIHPILDQLRHDICGFLQAPLLFLFVLSVMYSDFKLQKKHLYHLIPLVVSIIVWVPNFYFPYLGLSTSPNTFDYAVEIQFTYILAMLQILAYIIATYWIIGRYQKLYHQNYSSTKPYNYRWLLVVNHISVILFLVALTKNIVKLSDLDIYLYSMRILTVLVMLFFISWLVIKALYAPKIFRGIDSSLPLINSDSNKESQLVIKEKIEALEAYLNEHEPYLNPELTISMLAEELKMDSSELSLLINKSMGQNFYNLMNHYRIEKAKSILADPSKKHLTVLEILYSLGYNSKSSFNVAFKKSTGLTPSAYRKKHL